MSIQQIEQEIEKLPLERQAKCLMQVVSNLAAIANEEMVVFEGDIETCLEKAWQAHR